VTIGSPLPQRHRHRQSAPDHPLVAACGAFVRLPGLTACALRPPGQPCSVQRPARSLLADAVCSLLADAVSRCGLKGPASRPSPTTMQTGRSSMAPSHRRFLGNRTRRQANAQVRGFVHCPSPNDSGRLSDFRWGGSGSAVRADHKCAAASPTPSPTTACRRRRLLLPHLRRPARGRSVRRDARPMRPAYCARKVALGMRRKDLGCAVLPPIPAPE
jgi:hypothetical protein